MAHGDIRIGISGWTYRPWRGVFYPPKLPQRLELAFAAKTFNAIEINGTFYSLQRPESFAAWDAQTPDDFLFALKGPRYLTHMLKLKGPERPLANFFASGPLRLGKKLGPILWQLPPQMPFKPERLERFFQALPRTTAQALELARGHDERLNGRSFLEVDAERPIRHALEVRHESYRDPAFIDLLRRHDIALCCADTVDWPRLFDVTSDFAYVRLHGSEELYVSGYEPPALDRWAGRVRAWATGLEPQENERVTAPLERKPGGRDVFVFFDNDVKVRAPFDAQSLAQRVSNLMPERPGA